MPTIRVDQDVYEWLQARATPFEDTPNSVLRRLAGLDEQPSTAPGRKKLEAARRRVTGKQLAQEWDVDVKQARYHREGSFYENLGEFPGALFDPRGYVVFETRAEYERSPGLRIGRKLNVPDGIRSLPDYVRVATD